VKVDFHVRINFQAHYSTGAVAAGFTSTAMTPETRHEAAIVDEDLVRYERVKKKGTFPNSSSGKP